MCMCVRECVDITNPQHPRGTVVVTTVVGSAREEVEWNVLLSHTLIMLTKHRPCQIQAGRSSAACVHSHVWHSDKEKVLSLSLILSSVLSNNWGILLTYSP